MEEPQAIGSRRLRFGIFEVDWKKGELWRSGRRIRLQNQPFRLLEALLEHPGEIVTRKELQLQLWGADTTVDFDHSLGIAVTKLREALSDAAENPRFIETVPKQGYRFIAPVQIVEDEPLTQQTILPERTPNPAAPAQKRTGWAWPLAASLLALLAIGLGVVLVLRQPIRSPYRLQQITFSGHVLTNDLDIESFSSLASDGTRLYFSQIDNGNTELAVALTANGEIGRFELPPEIGFPLVGALSPDGSKLIVHSHLQAEPEQPLWLVPTLGGAALRVPHILAHDATWMPNGSQLLVAAGNELIVIDPDGENPHRLLTTPGPAFWMRWSPDGKRLRYTVWDAKNQISELWEASADGGNPHPFLPEWSHPTSECCGSWTSDGKYFVFQSQHNKYSEIWARREWLGGLFASQPWRLTGGPLTFQSPNPAPGTHRIDFIGANVRIQLLRFSPKTASFVPLERALGAAAMVSYSPDGKWVAWLNASDGSLWRSRIDGREWIELTTPPLTIFNLHWSADSQRLALMAKEPGKPWTVYLLDAGGGNRTPVLHEDRNEADPDWSPDGTSIVFGRLPDRMDNKQPKAIYTIDLSTHQVTQIPGSTGLFSPRFSPDGRYIAAIRLDQRALLLFDRAQQRWSVLTATHGVGDPVWSHDGRFLYFQDFIEAGKPIYRVAIPSGAPQKVATISDLRPIAATDYRLIGLAPGDLPIVSARTSDVDLYALDMDK